MSRLGPAMSAARMGVSLRSIACRHGPALSPAQQLALKKTAAPLDSLKL